MQLKLKAKWVEGGKYVLFLMERKRPELLSKAKVKALFPGFLVTFVIKIRPWKCLLTSQQ